MGPSIYEKRLPDMSKAIAGPYRKAIYIAIIITLCCVGIALFSAGAYSLYVGVSATTFFVQVLWKLT